MASETMNITEDAEMAECDGDKVVTMMDVLQEQQDFEEDANAVLGASDDKNCTYTKGYIKRQAIYACLTCCPDIKDDPSKRAGVCLACSLNCHENHDLVELYTKRNFRCDCGNPKFDSNPCQFTPNKTDLNNDNIYNQNFSGLYCICQRPYPDPEASFEDDMIQCIICEDWLHASHLDAVVPANDQYSEMICKACMEKNEFLYDYSNLAVNVEIVDVVTLNGNHSEVNLSNGDINMTDDKDKKLASTEEQDNKVTEDMSNDAGQTNDIDGNVDLNTDNAETKDKKNNDMVTDEVQKANDTVAESTDNERSEEIKEQNKADEQVTDEVDNDKADHDSISQDAKCEENDKAEKPVESSDTVEGSKISEDDIDTTEASNQDERKETSENSEEKSADTSKNIDVPDTSQEHLGNMEDKTDSVMDAIDALLESTNETKESDKAHNDDSKEKDISDETQTSNDEQTNNIDDNKKAGGDIEMTDSSSKNESLDKETSSENGESITIETANGEKSVETENMVNGDDSDKVTNEVNDTCKTKNNDESNTNDNETETSDNFNENKRKLSISEESSPKKVKLNASKCERPKGVKKVHKGALFWPSNFRQKLCTCGECISMYKDLHVLFLTDLEDTVSYYESLGKEMIDGGVSQYEKGLQALSSLDRIQQINALTEYNKMRDKLLDFLKSFKDKKEIVKEEDIKAFFAGMKPRREPDGVYFCR